MNNHSYETLELQEPAEEQVTTWLDSPASNINLRLHQAIEDDEFDRAKDIIREEGDDHESCLVSPNSDGELPLHLASKDDKYKEIVEALLTGCSQETKEKQLRAENKIFRNTPLHVAALLGNEEITEVIIKHCDDILIEKLLEKRNKLGDTPVHGPAAKNHLSILQTMYERVKGCIRNKGRFEGLPLHTACGYGNIEVVKKLVEWDESQLETESVPAKIPPFTKTSEPKKMEDDVKKKYRKTIDERSKKERTGNGKVPHHHYTPLTRACHFGHHEVVEFLLEKGAERNRFALTKAIDGLHHKCVKLLLFKEPIPDEQHLLSTYIPRDTFKDDSIDNSFDDPYVSTSAFCELIKYMPDIAEMVLNYKSVELEAFLVNSKNFQIKLLYEFVDGHSADSRKTERRNSEPIANTCSICPCTAFSKETHPLSLMVKHKRENLLTHPVVAAFIHHKWRSAYGFLSIIHWVLYAAIYMVCTNVLLFKLPNPNSDFCTQVNATNQSSGSLMSIQTSAFFVIVYSLVRLGFEGLQLITSLFVCSSQIRSNKQEKLYAILAAIKQSTYIWDLTNWIEIILFSLSTVFTILVFATNSNNFCLPFGQKQMGAAIIWLSWIEFIFLSTQFHFIGVHALMFMKILKTLMKVLPLALFLVFGFGLTFHFLVYDPNLMASPFSTPFYSFMKTLAMTVGDVGADEFFGFEFSGQTQDTSHLPHLELSISFWLLSLVLMTILLSNLMIGLAVGDIQAIADHATFTKLALQVDYLLTAETSSLFFKWFRVCRGKKDEEKVLEPNKQSLWETVKKETVYLIFGGVRYDSQESIERLITATEQVKELINELK